MQRFDITLKTMLQRQLQGGALARLLGFSIREWLDAELPEAGLQEKRVRTARMRACASLGA